MGQYNAGNLQCQFIFSHYFVREIADVFIDLVWNWALYLADENTVA